MSIYYNRQGQPIDYIHLTSEYEDFESRHVGRDSQDGVVVSTVFLAIDHRFGDGPPLIFETMIMGGKHDNDCWRYATEEEAMIGHAAAISHLFSKKDEDILKIYDNTYKKLVDDAFDAAQRKWKVTE